MQEESIEIINKLGLHARAATKLANTAKRYSSKIIVSYADKDVDCKSIMSLMLLAAAKGSVITLKIDGSDEHAAMDDIRALINARFEEEE
jgi:phosphocarrier protein